VISSVFSPKLSQGSFLFFPLIIKENEEHLPFLSVGSLDPVSPFVVRDYPL